MINELKIIEKENSVFEEKFKNTIFSSKIPLKNEIEKFLFENPKRLRPIFIILFSKILDISDERVFDIAILSELIHSASLVHDDILDNSKIRRNNESLNSKFNDKIALLIGDLLLSVFFEKISNQEENIIKIYSKYIKNTIVGEIEQNININKIPPVNEYYEKTFEKTGNLFICGLEALFELKEIEEKTKCSLLSFMKNYSLAFQIQNDIYDFNTNLSDFKNGNYTLPVIYFNMDNSLREVNENNIQKYLIKSQKEVINFKNKIDKKLEFIENSIYKQALIELVKYTLKG